MKKHLLLVCRHCMLFLFFTISPSALFSQSFNVYEIDNSAFPTIKAHVVARNSLNQEITNLTKDDFSVTENGISMDASLTYGCRKEDKYPPISVVLVLDVSPSMDDEVGNGEKRIDWVKIGAKAFIDSVKLEPPSSLAIVKFSGDVTGNSGFTDDKTDLNNYVDQIITVAGSTDFKPPFLREIDPLGAIASLKTKPAWIRRVVVFLSDGSPERIFQSKDVDRIVELVKSEAIQVFGIFVNMPINNDINWIAQESGGGSFRVDTKADLVNIYRIIVNEVQSQYYCNISWQAPSGCDTAEADRYRQIEITYKPKSVTASASYIMPLSFVPTIELSDQTLLFGRPGIGTSTRTFTLTPRVNDFILNGFALDPDDGRFTVQGQSGNPPFTMEKDKPYTITVNYVESSPSISKETKLSLNTSPCAAPNVLLIAPCGGIYPDALDFGLVAAGATQDRTETCIFRNTTLADITCEAVLDDPEDNFMIVSGGGKRTLKPDSCYTLTLRFKPVTPGDKSAEVFFKIPDVCGEPRTLLTGKSFTPEFPMATLDFGEKRLLTVNSKKYILINPSDADVNVLDIGLKNEDDENFKINLPSVPFTIPADGGSMEIDVEFVPKTEGFHDNYIELRIENIENKVSGRIMGIGTLPKIVISQVPEFPPAKIGEKSANQNLVITNPAAFSDLKVKQIRFEYPVNDFKFETQTLTDIIVNRDNGLLNIPMSFTPSSAGMSYANIIIKSDAGPGPVNDPDVYDTLLVSGEGLGLSVSPDSIDFRDVLICSAKESEVKIDNNGSTNLSVFSAVVDDQQNFGAEIIDESVGTGYTGIIKVYFHPVRTGDIYTLLRISTSNGDTVIYLYGKGTQKTLKADFDGTIDYNNLQPQMNIPFTFSVKIPDIPDNPVSSLDFCLSYYDRMLMYDPSKCTFSTNLSAWNWTVNDIGRGKIKICGSGPGLTKETDISCSISMLSFLSDVSDGYMFIMPDPGNKKTCLLPSGDSIMISLRTCFTQGRLVKFVSDKYSIVNISPNPAIDMIILDFSLGLTAMTRIELYNSMGQPVKKIRNEVMNNGPHKIEIPVGDLSDGVYTLSFVSGPYNESRQIVVLK